MSSKSGAGKYKGLLLTIFLFLAFFIIICLMNLYLGNAVNDENIRLNIIKEVNLQADALEPGIPDSNSNLESMRNQLNTLLNGGQVGQQTLPKLNKSVDDSNVTSSIASLTNLINNGTSNTNDLSKNLSALQNQWQGILDQKTKRFKILQYAAIILGVVYFLGIIFQLVRNFDTIDSEIEVVKNETENILSTVNEGLFLLSSDLEIGAQQSQALKNIFGLEDEIEGNFIDFLSSYVSENTLEIAKDFLGLLFGKRVKEKLIDDLNPLKKIQINIERRDGSYETHYIDFDFKRVVENKEIQYILGSATDVTQSVLLEQELEETKIQSEAQIDLFLSVLHVPPKQLQLFINDTNIGLNKVNGILKDTANKDYQDKTDQIYRIVHKVKGDAALLNLHSFEVKAHEFEEVLAELKSNPKLKGEDLLPLAIHLKGMLSHQDSFLNIFDKFDENKATLDQMGLKKSDQGAAQEQSHDHSLKGLAVKLADEYGKHVELVEYASLQSDLNVEQEKLLNDCKIQLLRNAVTHGIEGPQERLSKGKNSLGSVYISTVESEDYIDLIVKDDGAGIDIESIQQKALDKGILDEETLASLTEKQIASLIFRSDFSTKDSADMNAGRGIGMNLVKNIVKDLNAKIAFNWQPDKYTVFKIRVPIKEVSS